MKTQTYKTPSCSFTSTSRTKSTTQLYDWDFPDAPSVFYTEDVYAAIRYLVDTISTEVGWLGLVDTLDDGNYLVTDIYVPEQTVTGTETDIDAETLCELAMEIENAGKESEKLLYWGHSHVTMDVGPSGQDEIQIEQFLDNGCNIFIRGIYNKQGASKVDVYDVNNNCIHQCVDNGLRPTPMPKALKKSLDKIIKDKIKKPIVKNLSRLPNVGGSYYNPNVPFTNNDYVAKPHGMQSVRNSPGWGGLMGVDDYYDEYYDDYHDRDIINNPFGFKE